MAKKKSRSAKRKSTSKSQPSSLAAALQQTKANSTSGIKHMSVTQLMMITVLWFIGHSLVIYLAGMFFPNAVVLGTHLLSQWEAIAWSMLVFTLIAVGAMPVIETLLDTTNWKWSNLHWFGAYWLINVVAIWVVARFAEMLGLGISSWLVAVWLGLAFDLVQGVLVKFVAKD